MNPEPKIYQEDDETRGMALLLFAALLNREEGRQATFTTEEITATIDRSALYFTVLYDDVDPTQPVGVTIRTLEQGDADAIASEWTLD